MSKYMLLFLIFFENTKITTTIFIFTNGFFYQYLNYHSVGN